MSTLSEPRALRRQQILSAGSLDAVLDRPGGVELLEEEASDPDGLIDKDQLTHLLAVREQRRRSERRLGIFFSTDDVIVVPGFMGSTLRDEAGPNGLIWIDPRLFLGQGGSQLAALTLAKFVADALDRDATPGVRIDSRGALPLIYDLLAGDLEVRRYDVQVFPFDWRKNIDHTAAALAARIRGRVGQKPRPLHIIAHSQGSLVARRAIQFLGVDVARRHINNLVLLGPASYGTFSAAFAIAGTHESIATLVRLGVKLPPKFETILRSFTGLYQLLPWKPGTLSPNFDPAILGDAGFWQGHAEPDRLNFGFRWGRQIDTSFFNDRTVVILGDQPTVGAVKMVGGRLEPDGDPVPGDGTVPDLCARLPGVRTYRAAGEEHMKLPLSRAVLAAVRAVLRGDTPRVERVPFAKPRAAMPKALLEAARSLGVEEPVPTLPKPPRPTAAPRPTPQRVAAKIAQEVVSPNLGRPEPTAPPCRQLRVFSFDPLLATNLDLLTIAEITIGIPWEDNGALAPGPVGEYIEVVDYDPASACFYHPLDLAHPRLMAMDGLPANESDPQFHQQMAYAVSMATIETFEKALGRVALWAPRLPRDPDGNPDKLSPDERYVPRLRIYPHGLRDANAYYDPDRHVLLFGYFPSRELPGGESFPGGTVFTCQSFDIIAHETTHALLHGLHRYYLDASNPDVFAFHEAFADAVALFQHFSHTEVVRQEVALTRGDLRKGGLLGRLAQQFGAALGNRGGLRKYVDMTPDPGLIATTDEPHDRGAILMAALFRAFLNIYQNRTKDLYRIATGGTGVLPDGDIHPDLVNRLAVEAAKSARHILTMCVRALDYVPPVDLTFGEYLRALITADYDLVRDDDRGYRVSVIDAFRSWGLYPTDVNVLDETALRWRPPDIRTVDAVRKIVRDLPFTDWNLRADRRAVFLNTLRNGAVAHAWVQANAHTFGDDGKSIGLVLSGNDFPGIRRDAKKRPVFEIHSLRPCCRVGPDGQQRVDLVAEVVQRRAGYLDDDIQQQVDSGKLPWTPSHDEYTKARRGTMAPPPDFYFRGGCTLVIDPESGQIRYCIRKSIRNNRRLERQRKYERTGAIPGPAATYFGLRGRNPFALLHGDE